MKNTIKKIAAAAMAFTLLGTGTAVTKTIAPKADNTIVAFAKEKVKTYLYLDSFGDNAQAQVVYYPGVCSRVAPNMKAKTKKYYKKGEIFNIKTYKGKIVIIEDDYYDWVVTTSGYYVPVRYKYNYV